MWSPQEEKDEEAIDVDEEEEADGLAELPQKSKPLVKREINRMSTVSSLFNRGNKDKLSKDEQKARDMANPDGTINPEAALENVRRSRRLMKLVVALVVLVCGSIITILVQASKSRATVNEGTVEVKDAIAKSTSTSVGMDNNGHSVLQDVHSNQQVSVRGFGDPFATQTKVDPITDRQLSCMNMGEVAELFHDAVSRTGASITFVDENGIESEVVPVNGHFVDHGRTLQFGTGEDGITMIMDSNACNTGVLPTDVQDDSQVESEESEAGGGDLSEGEEDSDTDGVFKRGLREPSSALALVPASPSRKEVLDRHRNEFAMAKDAIRNGRRVQTLSTVQVCSGSNCASRFDEALRIVFVTSTTYTGNLGGLNGANDKCQARADAAELAGTFKAWISTGSVSPFNWNHNGGYPYYLVDGTKIADNWGDLVDQNLDHEINVNEYGVTVTDPARVWTSTNWNGHRIDSPHHCNNWLSGSSSHTGKYGSLNKMDHQWSWHGSKPCHWIARLYCIQQDVSSNTPTSSPTESPTSNPTNSPSSSPSLSPTVSLCTRSEDYSNGSAGDLTLDATGALTLNGNTTDARFFDNTTLGTAHDETVTFENVNEFIIPQNTTMNQLGTLVIYAKRIVIDGTLDGNGRGYPGAVATTTGSWQTDTYCAWSGTTPVCVVENEDRSYYREYSTVNHKDGNGYTRTRRTPCRDEDGNAVNGGQGRGGADDSGNMSGGGGAGHGGIGGRGGENILYTTWKNEGGERGSAYDNDSSGALLPGSGGGGGAGSPGGAGGAGGAAVLLYAEEIIINGIIKVNGNTGGRGPYSILGDPHGGGGGGSGGSVKLSSCTLTAGSGASIKAKGGNGGQARVRGHGGGGGGGGMVIFVSDPVNYIDNGMSVEVNGGEEGNGDTYEDRVGQPGSGGQTLHLVGGQ